MASPAVLQDAQLPSQLTLDQEEFNDGVEWLAAMLNKHAPNTAWWRPSSPSMVTSLKAAPLAEAVYEEEVIECSVYPADEPSPKTPPPLHVLVPDSVATRVVLDTPVRDPRLQRLADLVDATAVATPSPGGAAEHDDVAVCLEAASSADGSEPGVADAVRGLPVNAPSRKRGRGPASAPPSKSRRHITFADTPQPRPTKKAGPRSRTGGRTGRRRTVNIPLSDDNGDESEALPDDPKERIHVQKDRSYRRRLAREKARATFIVWLSCKYPEIFNEYESAPCNTLGLQMNDFL